MADHSVLVMELAFRSVVDDVLERNSDLFFAELNFERLIRFVAQTVKKQRVDSGWFHSNQTCQSSSFRAVTLACGTQTSEQVESKGGCLREFVCRQLRTALVEIIGNTHRANRVRARGAGPHFVELVSRDQDGPLRRQLDIQCLGEWAHNWQRLDCLG